MLGRPRWLTLEAKYLDRARSFYETHLGLEPERESDDEVVYPTGEARLRLRAPGAVPRGGLHVHYALSVPASAYDDWYERLDGPFDLTEHRFGDARSLYLYDPDGNCVELGEADDAGTDGDGSGAGGEGGITSLFEVVLEVEDLDAATAFYSALGCDVIDRGDRRRRVRLTAGDVDLELWEPHLGLADARGGVHVDWGIAADEPAELADQVRGDALAVWETDDGVRIRDPDGHYLTLCA
ncbi:VOC family protein [Halomicrobium urmianum]|uniref:VOC family protein n=1 Tax=Halomicrobium urmianum TaxID=1586233 RepID=UPI001CD9649A|nr:VOC family protein [Halomicrobium urmianum]